MSENKKAECWRCSQHILSIFLWTQRIGELSSIKDVDKEEYYKKKMAEFRDEDDSLLTNYSRIPQIASDFTDWRYEKMQEVVSFCKKRDLIPPNFFQECLNLDLIKQNDEAKLNPGERKIVEDFKEKYYKENWQTVLMKMMRYKKPMVANAHWLTKESLKMESGSEVFIHVAWLKPGRHTYLISHNS